LRPSEAGDVDTHLCFVFDEEADSFVPWGTISELRLLPSQHFFGMDIGAVGNSEGNLEKHKKNGNVPQCTSFSHWKYPKIKMMTADVFKCFANLS
jgi:hypothetical protein